MNQLNKGRLSVVYGSQLDGIAFFAQHLANKLAVKNESVQFLNYTHELLDFKPFLVRAKAMINLYLGVGNFSGVNIL